MSRLLSSYLTLRDDEDTVESFEAEFKTDDGREHTVMYHLDEYLYDELSVLSPVVYLSDFVTSFVTFDTETARACAEMLDMAEEQMMVTAADDYELSRGYTYSPERYDLYVSTHGMPPSSIDEEGVPRPTKPEGCTLILEEDVRTGTRFIVRDWNGQLHQILFRDGRLLDCDSGYSLLSADTLNATFAAIRLVQAEHLSRGMRLDTSYNIELYQADAVTEYGDF